MSRRQLAQIVCCSFVVLVGSLSTAQAIPPFMKAFLSKYAKTESENEQEKEFATLLVESAKCNVCHVQGKPKKQRNAYGDELAKLLKKASFSSDRLDAEPEQTAAEMEAAFEAVAALKSGDENSPTYGELLATFKLPGEAAPAAADAAPATEPEPSEPMPTPMPEPTADSPAPMPESPAPAAGEAMPAETSETPVGNVEGAIEAINKIGGTVMQLAQNDDSLVVDFHLGGTALTDDGLAQVVVLPKVVELNLKDTQITDAGLAQLASLGTLVKLHLEKTKVTDAGLVGLGGMDNLEYLNLYGTAVTDAGLEHLKPLAKLKKLYVWQTQVTDEGIAKLKEALPELTVVK